MRGRLATFDRSRSSEDELSFVGFSSWGSEFVGLGFRLFKVRV